MQKLKFLVTGTGRCGTAYAAQLLTSLGISCGHECIFGPDGYTAAQERLNNPTLRQLSYCSTHQVSNNNQPLLEWVDPVTTEAESSYLIIPYLDWPELENIPILHLVRHPLLVISSFVFDINYFSESSTDDPWQKQIYNFLPGLNLFKKQLERACYFYIKWNETIESQKNKRPYLLAQVETLDKNLNFYKFINKEQRADRYQCNNTNTFGIRKHNLIWDEIPVNLSGELKKIAKRYGYLGHQLL